MDDLANFALYQANQRTYETAFLKRFITHALHPEVLNSHFGHDSHVTNYLQSVTDNVKEIADRIIRNAHIKIIHFLSKNDAKSLPFLDTGSIKEDAFSDFNPKNLISVASRLNQAWHRVSTFSDMVKYSPSDYNLTNSRLPYAEVDEASIKLLNLGLVERLDNGPIIHIDSGARHVEKVLPLARIAVEPQIVSEPSPADSSIVDAPETSNQSKSNSS